MTTGPAPSLLHYFTQSSRADGTSFIHLTDDRPQWLADAVRDAHDDEAPNDWRYHICRQLVDALTGYYAPDVSEIEQGDVQVNIADAISDAESTFTHDVLTWAAGNTGRPGYYDDYLNEHGLDPFHTPVDGLRVAMFQCVLGMTQTLADAIAAAHYENNPEV